MTQVPREDLKPEYITVARHLGLPDAAAADLYYIALSGVRENEDFDTIAGRAVEFAVEYKRTHTV